MLNIYIYNQSINLPFKGEKIYFTKELTDTQVKNVGKAVTLECEISKDGLKVDWYFGSKKLRRGEDYDITASGKTQTLTIEKTTEQSVGEYRAEYKTASTSCKLTLAGMLTRNLDNYFFCH